MKYIEIAGRKIGPEYPPLVIAEIGINHGGCLDVAKEMVDSAQRAGIEVVKHQTHIIEDEMSVEAKNIKPGNSDKPIFEIMRECSLTEQEELELKNYTESKGLVFISSPFSRAAADRLGKWDVPAFKIGSGECNNYPLLEHIASYKKPVILSTGMNTIESVNKALNIFKMKEVPVALLHTTNLYPTPPHLVRLGAFEKLRDSFSDFVVGLSDHTTSNHACFAAVALGASILERHYTDRMDRNGPDIINSMDEAAASELIKGAKLIWDMRGGEKEAAAEEKVTSDFAFASVVSTAEIIKGELFTTDNIWVRRPGTGDFTAEDYYSIIGKKAASNIGSNRQLGKKDVIW